MARRHHSCYAHLVLFIILSPITYAFQLNTEPRPIRSINRNNLIGRPKSNAAQPPCVRPSTLLHAGETDDEVQFVRNALSNNALFVDLPSSSLNALVDNFERREVPGDTAIITQGDPCDVQSSVYLVAEGTFVKVHVDGKQVPEPYGTIGPGRVFGELGVLYGRDRGATVTSGPEGAVVYEIPGGVFVSVLNSTASSQEIDDLINQVMGTQALYGGDIVPSYRLERWWLWSHASGSITEINGPGLLLNMLACAMFVAVARYMAGENVFALDFSVPDGELPMIRTLSQVRELWNVEVGLTTFSLTFFVNQAFSFWKDVYNLACTVKQKISAFHLLLVTNVIRNEDGDMTPEAGAFLDEIGQCSRLFHVLLWAGLSKRFAALATSEGLRRMAGRGLMSERQLDVLKSLDLAENKLFMAPLEWMMIRTNSAMNSGIVAGDTATKGALLREHAAIRQALYTISDRVDGRMPFIYVRFVQIMVDTFVFLMPLALYPKLGEFTVIATPLITIFYVGLNDMGKIFLDPLNNEEFCKNAIFLDLGVLIRESNAVSTEWKKASTKIPF